MEGWVDLVIVIQFRRDSLMQAVTWTEEKKIAWCYRPCALQHTVYSLSVEIAINFWSGYRMTSWVALRHLRTDTVVGSLGGGFFVVKVDIRGLKILIRNWKSARGLPPMASRPINPKWANKLFNVHTLWLNCGCLLPIGYNVKLHFSAWCCKRSLLKICHRNVCDLRMVNNTLWLHTDRARAG